MGYRIEVDRNLCDNHGQCAIAAPTAFWMNDNSELEFNPEPGDAVRDEVDEAADVCPVQAIFVVES